MKEHRGRKVKTKPIKALIVDMRENDEMSFEDIAKELSLNSRQMARWHYLTGKKLGL